MMRVFWYFDSLAKRMMWIANMTLVCAALAVAWFAMDRTPPFSMLSVIPTSARAGDWITIRGTVRRDIDRQCSADFSRFLFDSGFTRYDLGSSTATAEMISGMENRAPGIVAITLKLPENISVGDAVLVSSLEYRCNKIHRLWPIEVTTEMPFRVLP